MTTSKIIEQTFILSEQNELCNLISKGFGEEIKDKSLEAHIVYIDTKPKELILASYGSINRNPKRTNFMTLLKSIDCSDFNKLLLVVSTYTSDYSLISSDAKLSLPTLNVQIDKLLKDSNGWLVYAYQLEQLYTIATGASKEQAVEFRRKINKKYLDAYEEAKSINLFNTELNEVILSRMKLDYVVEPSYSKTYRLFQYLNSN
ncbi:MAG: hypothetical protein IPH24_17850 [Crocinitomicaceae bacterium]|nr:hypothetical protein [Crocinitomicaceae bacterium]